MQIFIMRHGQADTYAESDAQRQLTPHGRLEAALMGKWLGKMAIAPDVFWVSPFIRAQQTFEELAKPLSYKTLKQTNNFITPSGSATEVHDLIDGELAVKDIKQLMLVSHMPVVSYLVSELTSHQQAPIFQTAGIVEINYDPESMTGEFVRMVSPSDLY